jgi:hypothetical protein
METISNEEKAPSVVNLDSSQPMIEHALGVQWNVQADKFSIKVTKQDKGYRGLFYSNCIGSILGL